MQAVTRIRLTRDFLREVLAEPGGEHLLECSDCGTCVGTCPVSQRYPDYNPRLLFHKISLGMRDQVLSSPELWMCSQCEMCYRRCPRQIHISDVMKAVRTVALRAGHGRIGPTATVNTARCTACGMCAAACPYSAIQTMTVQQGRASKEAAVVDATLCMGCGICSAVCPSVSISVAETADAALHTELRAKSLALTQEMDEQEASVLAVVCEWCLRAAPDLAYAAEPPPGIRVIRTPCSGRVSPTIITAALQQGVEGVLVVGCRQEECHYKHGNELEQTRLTLLRNLLDLLGLPGERVQFTQLGALDYGKLRPLVEQMRGELRALRAERAEAIRRLEMMRRFQSGSQQLPLWETLDNAWD